MTLPPFLTRPPTPPELIKPPERPWTKRQLIKRFGEAYARKVFAIRGEKW